MANISLVNEYQSLYAIASNKHMTVAAVFESIPISLHFHRNLIGNNREL